MTVADPWSGLSAKVDGRRVDASHPWNWFWGVTTDGGKALLLAVNNAPTSPPSLPRMKEIDVRFKQIGESLFLLFRLTDSAHAQLFQTLCLDVVEFSRSAASEEGAVTLALRRTHEWQKLLRGGSKDLLTEEAQKGLIGELIVLGELSKAIGPSAAVQAWTGPFGSPKDFEFSGTLIEVKTYRGVAGDHLKISNHEQLADVAGRALWLVALAVDSVDDTSGRSLTDVVDEARSAFGVEPDALLELDERLELVGYRGTDDYTPWRWQIMPLEAFEVGVNFPRLCAIPDGVERVKYDIRLATCRTFLREWSDVLASVEEG